MKQVSGKKVVGVLLLIVMGLSLLALAIQKATNHRKEEQKKEVSLQLVKEQCELKA